MTYHSMPMRQAQAASRATLAVTGPGPGVNRQLGIPVIGTTPWGTHLCQFYRTKLDLIETLVPYFRSGLRSNEFCLWITGEPLEAAEAAAAMRASAPDFGDALRRGQIEIASYTDWYLQGELMDYDWMLASLITKLHEGVNRGFDGMRASGNLFWVRPYQWSAFAQYEAELNRVIGKYPMIALCTYALDHCDSDQIRDVATYHEFALARDNSAWTLMSL